MKKGARIGIGIAVVVIAIIFGIASIPDEVLMDSPSLEASENIPIQEEAIIVPPIPEEIIEEEPIPEEIIEEEPIPEEIIEEEPIEESEEESEEETTEKKIITVEIRDGIGSKDR